MPMRILVENLQKRSGLATDLFDKYTPNVMLVQEIDLKSELIPFPANNVSSMGYGTAIGGPYVSLENIKQVTAPFAELGGMIHKKTTIATATANGIQFVSFHGYNGQPFKNKDKLVAHVEAVLQVLESGPALFAGDFNTWTAEHLDAVTNSMTRHGFDLAYSWPYPGRDQPLDHVFARDVTILLSESYSCASDHRGAILEIVLATDTER